MRLTISKSTALQDLPVHQSQDGKTPNITEKDSVPGDSIIINHMHGH